MWPLIEAEEAQQGNVSRTCQLLEVSRSAFYTHRQHAPSRRALDDADLTERIIAIPRSLQSQLRVAAGPRPAAP